MARELKYRPCVGVMLANAEGKVFVGQRIDNPDSDAWQMPQGGIDEGQDLLVGMERMAAIDRLVKRLHHLRLQ